jgi:hypothetical protein
VNANSERLGKLQLRQPDESPKRDDVLAVRSASAEDSLSLLPRNRPSEVPVGQLADVIVGD